MLDPDSSRIAKDLFSLCYFSNDLATLSKTACRVKGSPKRASTLSASKSTLLKKTKIFSVFAKNILSFDVLWSAKYSCQYFEDV